jgi:predicted type IV restriction endonuclease
VDQGLLGLVRTLQSDNRLESYDEAATKQVIILRLLAMLGWNPFDIDEVQPEYIVGVRRVDYVLKHNRQPKVFIEVKKVREGLEKHQPQLLDYAFREGVRLAMLTNGITWWFYLPLNEGSWEQRKFYTIELHTQDAEDIAQKFQGFLAKDNVVTGQAVINAEQIYSGNQRQYLIQETLPKAWMRLVTEPDELLVELIAETTEKLCGYRPNTSAVESFLRQNLTRESLIDNAPRETTPHIAYKPPARRTVPEKRIFVERAQTYAHKEVAAFVWKGTEYKVDKWIYLLLQVCNIMASINKNDFDRVLELVGRKRPYFSKDPDLLRGSRRVEDTDIYVETNLSANSIVQLSHTVISLFGYSAEDLEIKTK